MSGGAGQKPGGSAFFGQGTAQDAADAIYAAAGRNLLLEEQKRHESEAFHEARQLRLQSASVGAKGAISAPKAKDRAVRLPSCLQKKSDAAASRSDAAANAVAAAAAGDAHDSASEAAGSEAPVSKRQKTLVGLVGYSESDDEDEEDDQADGS